MARRRVGSPRRLHRHQPAAARVTEGGGARAVDRATGMAGEDRGYRVAAAVNFFHRCWGSSTIGFDANAVGGMVDK